MRQKRFAPIATRNAAKWLQSDQRIPAVEHRCQSFLGHRPNREHRSPIPQPQPRANRRRYLDLLVATSIFGGTGDITPFSHRLWRYHRSDGCRRPFKDHRDHNCTLLDSLPSSWLDTDVAVDHTCGVDTCARLSVVPRGEYCHNKIEEIFPPLVYIMTGTLDYDTDRL